MKNIFSVIVMLIIANTGWTQLYISTGATLSLSGNAQVSLQDIDLVNDGVISAPADGRFIFNGTNANFISGSASPSFSELEIAKTGSGLLTLQSDINVKNKIVFTSNLIELNNYNIDLGTTGLLEGENENSHITRNKRRSGFVFYSLKCACISKSGQPRRCNYNFPRLR